MHTTTLNTSARKLFTDSDPVPTSPSKVTRTFESPRLESRLNGEADAEREDRARRALLDALGRLADCD